MWRLTIAITMTSLEVSEWYDEEAGERVTASEWGEEEAIAALTVEIDHTGNDSEGEYLPDDEVTADRVYEAVTEWQGRTGLVDDETTIIGWNYNPERAKKCR